MKKILGVIGLGLLGMGLGFGQVQPAPDVFLRWEQTGIPLANLTTQTINVSFAQTDITKYSFHYVYFFFNGACVINDIGPTTHGSIGGTIPKSSGSGSYNIQLGGLLPPNFAPVSGSLSPLLVMKGNGSANGIGASLTIVSPTPASLSTCTMDILYKGTVVDESAVSSVREFSNTLVEIDNGARTPVVATVGALTTYTYTLSPSANIGVEQVTYCVLPSFTTGLFSATTPVTVYSNIVYATGGRTSLGGTYPLLNNCVVANIQNGNYGVMTFFDTIEVIFSFPTAAGYSQGPGSNQLTSTIYSRTINIQ